MSNQLESKIEIIAKQLVDYYKSGKEFVESDVVQALSDSSKVASIANNVINLISEKRLSIFMKSLNGENIIEEDLEKLERYLTNEKRAEFVLDLFRKVIQSQTNKAPMVLGIIANNIVYADKDVSHEEVICINALMQFYDFDFENLNLLYNFVSANKRKYFTPNNLKFSDFLLRRNAEKTSVLLTLEKCVSLQLITKEYETDISVEYDKDFDSTDVSNQEVDEYYSFNSVGEKIISYIKKAKIID